MLARLDHLFEYMIDRISTHDSQSALVFENGAKLVKTDKRQKWSKELVGQRFISVEDMGSDNVVLYFNQDQIAAVKGSYLLFDPNANLLIDPHAPLEDIDFPPDPSEERISSGPSDEQVRRELSRGSQSEEKETRKAE